MHLCKHAFISLISTFSFAQTYGLESLTNEHRHYIAPAKLQAFMRLSLKSEFLNCIKYSKASKSERENYFGAIKIDISKRYQTCWAVFPSKYCSVFFGAHAITYWIVLEQKPGNYTILYDGHSDGFDIQGKCTNGFRDFKSQYNNTFTYMQFNGSKYIKTSDGEYPQ
jgi:hypothetical protein